MTIRVGSLRAATARLSRPISDRRTLPYTKRRRARLISSRMADAAREFVVNDEDMIFDPPPAELPVATLRARDIRTKLRADLIAWLSAKWQWFRPRTVPIIVALVGMLAVIGSASYLRNFARPAPERLIAPSAQPTLTVNVDLTSSFASRDRSAGFCTQPP